MAVRILCDRHHAGLLYSLQLLFEDRMGGDLYIPVGHDWWDEGYWQFGAVFGDDRLARQYLEPNPPIQADRLNLESDGDYFTWDPEYPTRLIKGVSLERFRELEWDYVLASVQENQHGFNALAMEADAKYLLQVGNRGQRVAWDLDPIALVSAEAPIEGRGVVYHQEYDKDGVFAYRHPSVNTHILTSFVNCFDRIPPEYALFQEITALLPEFKTRVHGHDGRDGLVQPTTAIAAEMGGAGFAWHDKPQGDGFGHVIHYWASVGRPLIGHAEYYDGLMPGPLWEDGVTCVDLGARDAAGSADMIRRIARDPDWHQSMCAEIRRRVDELVDFDAEYERIRALLEG